MVFICVIAVVTIRLVSQSGHKQSVPEITDAQVPLAMPDIVDSDVMYPSIETVTNNEMTSLSFEITVK